MKTNLAEQLAMLAFVALLCYALWDSMGALL